MPERGPIAWRAGTDVFGDGHAGERIARVLLDEPRRAGVTLALETLRRAPRLGRARWRWSRAP